jgi:D-tyrosyl-tRNA(Tyr) deacylase
MRATLQRVTEAEVRVEGATVGKIGRGWLVLLGVGHGDSEAESRKMAEKVVHLRLFEDDAGKFNRSVLDVGGEVLVVSQFTLYADASRGRRPSFVGAAEPLVARRLVDSFAEFVEQYGVRTQAGQFQAHMDVRLHNDGPVTINLVVGE